MLELSSGLAPFQVLQQNDRGLASATLAGTCTEGESGAVEARVLFRAFSIEDWDWKTVGEASDGKWSAALERIPAGGPYVIELRPAGSARDSTRVKEILAGDLWILAGQSNMEGKGDLTDPTIIEKPNPLVHCLDMADRWLQAEEPLHWLCDSPDPVHTGQSEPLKLRNSNSAHAARTQGAGLGLPFASELVKRTGAPIGIIPCAHGGTSISQWDPALRDHGGRSLYGSMFRRFGLAGGRVRGVLWYQGETDARDGAAKQYRSRLEQLIGALRRDFGNPNLPFLMVQIGRQIAAPAREYPPNWNAIQEIQREFAVQPGVEVVAAVDLELDDGIHVGTQGLKRLGRRLASVAHSSVYGDRLSSSLRLISVQKESERIRVAFGNVSGRLLNDTRINGFSIRNRRGEKLDLIFDVTVDRANPSVAVIHLTSPPPRGAHLWYGFGHDPYCNLADQRDHAAPVFGPIPLKES